MTLLILSGGLNAGRDVLGGKAWKQFEKVVGEPAPAKPWDQLTRAIAAVFDS